MNPNRSRIHLHQQGFTLVEIMVVIVIIGLLATIVTSNVLTSKDVADVQKAQTDVRQIADAVKMYMLQNPGVPTMEQLTTEDEKGHRWVETMSQDPWGNDYVIRPGDRRNEFEVISFGPDKSENTEDDISSKTIGKKK